MITGLVLVGGCQRQGMQMDYSIMVCSDSLVKVEPMHRNSSHGSEARTSDRTGFTTQAHSRNASSVLSEVETTSAAMQAEDRVHLNVGGELFVTYKQTLAAEPHSVLARLGQPSAQRDTTDQNGNIFIDRDGSQFRLVLNFMRDGSCCLPSADQAVEELLTEAQHYRVRAVYRLLAIENVTINIMDHILLQVLGLVALINAHKDSKARNLAESGALPTSQVPVRRPRTFRQCLTTVAVAYIACSMVCAVIMGADGPRETRHMQELRQMHKLESCRLMRDMYKLRN